MSVNYIRLAAAFFGITFVLTACGGGGGGRSSVGLPGSGPAGNGTRGNVQFTLTIPAANSTSSSARRTPQTVSSQTQSVAVTVNGGTPQITNVSSSTCTGTAPIVCTISVGAPYGLDGFLVLTYSGQNATGTALNAAAFTFNVTQGGNNSATVTAGNLLLVTSNADGSGGSYSCASGSTTCTLREAVAEASTTAGVVTAIMFQGVTSITVGSQIEIGQTAAQNIVIIGPGATAAGTGAAGAPSQSSQLTISGGGTSGILYVYSGSLTVDGLTFTNGNNGSDGRGGAIENEGSLSIVNTIFTANNGSNNQYGGAVFDDGSNTTIVASTFTNNSATSSGGAYWEDAGATISHTLFSGNSVSNGESCVDGGAIYTDWDLSVDSSTFTGNVAGSTTISGQMGSGGAIYLSDGSMAQSITNSTFGGTSSSQGNFAGGPGSSDEGYGGAIYNYSGYNLALSGNTFSYNKAKGYEAGGGAIFDYDGIISASDTFTSNVADSTASTTGYSEGYGGAVFTDSTSSWTSDTFSQNQALGGTGYESEGGGGAMYAEGQFGATQTTFSNNTGSGAYYAYGGALYLENETETASLSNVQITNNTVTATIAASPEYSPYATGAGIYIYAAPISMQNVTVSGNTATANGNGSYPGYAYGAGLEYYYGDYYIDDESSLVGRRPQTGATRRAQVLANLKTAHANARSHAYKKDVVTPANVKHVLASKPVAHPFATRKVESAPTNGFDTVTFSNNTANGGQNGFAYGGGAEFSGYPTFNAVSFTGNVATASGAGSYAVGGGFTYGDEGACYGMTFTGTVSGNSATNQGGGIWNECGLTVLKSTISGNSVTAMTYGATSVNGSDGGGGIWNYDTVEVLQSLITGNTVSGSATSAGGGGINNYDGDLYAYASTLYANTSSVDGGGLENVDGGYTYATNVTVYQNTATGNGGNVSNDPSTAGAGSTYIYVANSILAAGTAAHGSDAWNLDNVYSYGYNLVQQSSNFGSGTANVPQTGDIVGSNPQLASGLASNGGPTQTLADTGASPGRGVIPFASGECNGQEGTNVDQRGYTRGAGGVCDIGAYEFAGVAGSGTISLPEIVNKRNAH